MFFMVVKFWQPLLLNNLNFCLVQITIWWDKDQQHTLGSCFTINNKSKFFSNIFGS
jgi:hypothetical protein